MTDESGRAKDLHINTVVFFGELAELRRRLAAGADPNDDIDGHTLLMVVAEESGDYGDTEVAIMEALLAAGADVQRVDRTGRTALHGAAGIGNEAAVVRLLEAGCDPNQQAFDGSTPLHDAARGVWVRTIELLLAAGSRVDLDDETGATPLDVAEGLAKVHEPEKSDAIQVLRGTAARPSGESPPDR